MKLCRGVCTLVAVVIYNYINHIFNTKSECEFVHEKLRLSLNVFVVNE